MNVLVTQKDRKKYSSKEYLLNMKDSMRRIVNVEKIANEIVEERMAKHQSPYVTIRILHPNKFKEQSHSLTVVKDVEYGVEYGIHTGYDTFNNPTFERINVSETYELNLKNPYDAKIFAVLRMWPKLKGSPLNGTPMFALEDPISLANDDIKEFEAMEKALSRAKMLLDNPEELIGFSRLIGNELNNDSSFIEVKSLILKTARTTPSLFNELYDLENRAVRQQVKGALEYGIIEEGGTGGYLYKGNNLGESEEEVAAYLRKDRMMLSRISESLAREDVLLENVKESLGIDLDSDDKKEDDEILTLED